MAGRQGVGYSVVAGWVGRPAVVPSLLGSRFFSRSSVSILSKPRFDMARFHLVSFLFLHRSSIII